MDSALTGLRKQLKKQGLGTRFEGQTLEAALKGLGREKKGAVVFQIGRIPLESSTGGQYYAFYTVIGRNLQPEVQKQAISNMNRLNMRLLLGAYGIVPETGVLFHKYVYKMTRQDPETEAELLYRVFVDLVAIVYRDYDRIFAGIAG